MSKGVSVIVVNYGTPDLLMNFLNSVERISYDKHELEVIVVDNGFPSKGDSRRTIGAHRFSFRIHFAQNRMTSYASAINIGARLAAHDVIVISNSDIELPIDFSFEPILHTLEQHSNVGIVGPQLMFPDGKWQRSYGPVPSLKELLLSLSLLDATDHVISRHLMAWRVLSRRIRPVEYADGAFLIVRRICFTQLGGFSEDYAFYAEDADFCWRARLTGWAVVFLPTVYVVHLRGASSTQKAYVNYTMRQFRAKLQFVAKYRGFRHAYYYRILTKLVLVQRFLFYSFIAVLMPLPEFEARKQRSKLSYIAAKSLPKH